ncbi:hypothetical protein EU508_07075 [Pseudoalteromonas fuliginea]|uniref:Uncharacterized protein n=1 Tax=Pseudoalteromonas fuliginea TaxID=1872678 RepID=A0AB73BI79_9GAMM|nr:hypothetical protein EU508_07075 [Pseudoalteromonas fuliginea]
MLKTSDIGQLNNEIFALLSTRFSHLKIDHLIRVCCSFKVEFAAVCLVFRQGRAYAVWLFPINGR